MEQDQSRPRSAWLRRALIAMLVVVNIVLLQQTRLGPAWLYRADPPAPTTVLVILDTVRADRLGACGHHRPTTPVLDGLVGRGASLSCRAYSPGGWTVPSHASYFTGLPVPAHGVHLVEASEHTTELHWEGSTVRPLENVPTLAMRFKERGYQTVLVSANALLNHDTGLAAGFDIAEQSPDPRNPLAGLQIADMVRAHLRTLPDDKPLFLVINLMDAHTPYRAIPDGLGWLPPTPSQPAEDKYDYLEGKLDEAQTAKFLAEVDVLYDYGLHRADEALGAILDELDALGWTAPGMRLGIVSDHGELLGEHDIFGHGIAQWEPNVRVPMLYLDTTAEPVVFPEPVSALVIHDLILEGRLPDPLPPVQSVQFKRVDWAKYVENVGHFHWAVAWDGDRKLSWRNEAYEAYDLAADPGEHTPLPLPEDDPERPGFEVYVSAIEESAARETVINPDITDALKAMGYVH